jgi:hypothetical protein
VLLFIKESCSKCDHIQAYLGFNGLEGSIDLVDVDTIDGFALLVSMGHIEAAMKALPLMILGDKVLPGVDSIKTELKRQGLVP